MYCTDIELCGTMHTYHPTADYAAVTSSRLAVRTGRVIIGEKFLDLGGGAKFEKRFRYVTVFGFAYNYSLPVWWSYS